MRTLAVATATTLALLGAGSGLAAEDPRVPSVEDIMALRIVSSAEISPDGAHVAFVQHGENDRRVTIANGYQFRQLLLDKGIEARMIVYNGMGHGPSTPRMRRAINEHALAWFQEHLFGGDAPDFVHPVAADK